MTELMLNQIDEHTRECLKIRWERSSTRIGDRGVLAENYRHERTMYIGASVQTGHTGVEHRKKSTGNGKSPAPELTCTPLPPVFQATLRKQVAYPYVT
jgi:hypothetical protein